jgi:hypothetical protein
MEPPVRENLSWIIRTKLALVRGREGEPDKLQSTPQGGRAGRALHYVIAATPQNIAPQVFIHRIGCQQKPGRIGDGGKTGERPFPLNSRQMAVVDYNGDRLPRAYLHCPPEGTRPFDLPLRVFNRAQHRGEKGSVRGYSNNAGCRRVPALGSCDGFRQGIQQRLYDAWHPGYHNTASLSPLEYC